MKRLHVRRLRPRRGEIRAVRVGPFVYQVRYVPHLHDQAGRPIMGALYGKQSLIEIEQALDPLARRVTLWHELIEMISRQSGFRLSEEEYDCLAYEAMGVLRNNTATRTNP